MTYPKRIRVRLAWSEPGAARFRGVYGLASKLPSYKWITVESLEEELRYRSTPRRSRSYRRRY